MWSIGRMLTPTDVHTRGQRPSMCRSVGFFPHFFWSAWCARARLRQRGYASGRKIHPTRVDATAIPLVR